MNSSYRVGMITTTWREDPAPAVNARRIVGWWLWGWPAICHLSLNLLFATGYLVLTVLLLVAVPLVPVLGIGLPLLAAVLLAAVGAARLDLLRLEAATGVAMHGVEMHGLPAASGPGPAWRRHLLGLRTWRSMAWVAGQACWGLISASVVFSAACVTLALVTAPLYIWVLPERSIAWPWGTSTSGPWWLLLITFLGVLGCVITPFLATGLVTVDRLAARALLTGSPDTEKVRQLNRRVQTLSRTRAATVGSVEAERRRIERDLHDGPQQRLVALAMDLGLARERLARDPEGARELMDKAHGAAKAAVVEMRQVARGIHPPILTDRGLDAAISALAARSPVPVTVTVELPIRPNATVEAIAYFCVSEALTNVAKHARARQVRLLVTEVGQEWLRIEVEDDGVGGAHPDADGTGLRGLADRAAAIDGAVHLSSPAGGPTLLTIHLPLVPVDPPGQDDPEPAHRLEPGSSS